LAKRRLRNIDQLETETIEEFAQRVLFTVQDAYRGSHNSQDSIDKDAMEYFLQGTKDKSGAFQVYGRKPNSLRKAIKYLKEVQATKTAVYGRSRDREFRHRQVSWQDGGSEDFEVRQVQTSDLEQVKQKVQDLENLLKSTSRSVGDRRYSSPSPNRSRPLGPQCYRCQGYGHLAKDCSTPAPRGPSPTAFQRNGSLMRERTPSPSGSRTASPMQTGNFQGLDKTANV